MRVLISVLILLILSGCAEDLPSSEFEGVWRSDRELTVANFTDNENLTIERKEALREHLGKLFVSFRGNETRLFFGDELESEALPLRFKVVVNNSNYFDIEISESLFESNIVRYYRSGACYYLEQKEYGYNEYFCKYEDT